MKAQFIFRIMKAIIFMVTAGAGMAQDFKVESFRVLPNDVSAFVQPVTDLNDEACALIKVEASPDFEFSTPLGIVKRTDKTGEIWLYIPKGSKKITIKHPQWGVLRDYAFPSKIESHVAYELRVSHPHVLPLTQEVSPVVTMVHDTLVVTRTDTMLLTLPKKRIPLTAILMAGAAWGGSSHTLSGSLMAALMKRHGGFIRCASDFGRLGATVGTCDKEGYLDGRLPYYSGKTRHSFMTLTAGGIHRLSDKIRIFEGLGYGYDNSAWALAESEGGGFVKNSYYCHKGIAFEAGVIYSLKRLSLGTSILSIKGSQWYATLSIGINLTAKRHEK